MSDRKVKMLLARMWEDTIPSVVAAVDEAIWEHWTDGDEAAWIEQGKQTWGIKDETDFKVITATFKADSLIAAFATPVVEGEVGS